MASENKRPSRGERLFKQILFLIGLVSIIIMLVSFHVSIDDLKSALGKSGWALLAVVGIWVPLYLMSAVAWREILKGSGPNAPSLWKMYRWTISGFALNSLTPMGLLGGEPYKIMELKDEVGTQRATSSVILFSMMHIYTHFWFWLTAIVAYLILYATGLLPLKPAVFIIIILSTLFCIGLIYLFRKGYKNGFVLKFLHGIGHVWGLKKWAARMEEKHLDSIKTIDQQISELQSQDRKIFNRAFAIEYIGRLLMSCEVFIILVSLGMGGVNGVLGYITLWLHSFLILAFTSLFANLVGFIPMQLGTREGGYVMSAVQFGLSAATGMVISIVCRLREIIWDGIGLLLMKIK